MVAEPSKSASAELAGLPAGEVVRVVLTGRVDTSAVRNISFKSADFASPAEVREARIQALRRAGQAWKDNVVARAHALGLSTKPSSTFTAILIEGAVEGVCDLIDQVHPRSVILDRPISFIEPTGM